MWERIKVKEILDNTTVVVVIFALVGLVVAYVTFGLLNSQAQGQFHSYQVGGAAAGFAVTFLLLTTFYRQVQRASNEPRELRERIEELQQKLLRGSPRPLGFIVEISEQQKIVLARPEKWHKRGGMMFDFEVSEMTFEDHYPARFTCSFVPITDVYEKLGMDKFYKIFEENIKKKTGNERNYYPRCEFIFIGGENQSTKCIKVIAGQYMRLEFRKNEYGGKDRLEAFQVTEDEYLKNAALPSASANAESLVEQAAATTTENFGVNGRPPVRVKFVKISHMFVACYRPDLKNVYFFEFMDDDDDFVKSSEIFNQVLNSTRFLN